MLYFNHDTTASRDHGITALRLEHGSVAVDLYWVIIEKIYDDEQPINLDETNWETKSVTHLVNVGFQELKTYVETMIQIGLLEGDIKNLTSERAMANIAAYHKKAETARQNGKKGGRKTKAKTNGKPTGFQDSNQRGNQCALNKIKENKGVGGKLNPPNATALSGAGEKVPAPPSGMTTDEVIAWVDENYPDHIAEQLEHRAKEEQLKAASVPCPPEIMAKMKGGAA